MKNMKKLASVVLAATTVCAMSVSAFASAAPATDAPKRSIGFSATLQPLTINVVVPTNSTFTIDPFNVAKNGQVVPVVGTMTNNMTIPANIMVTKCKGVTPAGVTLADATPPTAATTGKQIQLFLRAAAGSATISTGNASRYNAATATKAGDVLATKSGSTSALLVKLNAGASAAFGVTGVTSLSTAWAAADKVDVEVALDIQPQLS